jgi:DNA mismatch endonuclease (patch repair protein)
MPDQIRFPVFALGPRTLPRSEQMSRVRGRGNKSTELRFVAFLKAAKITGWRRHPKIFGKPDFVFPKRRIAIFVDGCFWHGCRLHGRIPKSNQEFWRRKIFMNQKRDREVSRQLRKAGWNVIRLWEHELRKANQIQLSKRLHILAVERLP